MSTEFPIPACRVKTICASCGQQLGRRVVQLTVDHHELISQAEGHGRILTVEAFVTCSTRCLIEHLQNCTKEDGHEH